MPISSSPILSPKPIPAVTASSQAQGESSSAVSHSPSPPQTPLWMPSGWTSVGLPVGPELVPPKNIKGQAPKITLLFGGSFNPPHRGHTWMVDQAIEALGHHDVWIMPSFVHAEKADLAPFEVRLAMCRAQFREACVPVVVQDLERLAPATGETADVLQWLQTKLPDRQFVLLFGRDLAGSLENWRCWPTLKTLAPIFVQPRGAMHRHGDASSEGLHPSTWSSTFVREAFKRGLAVNNWVAPGVARIIATEGLYAPTQPSEDRAA